MAVRTTTSYEKLIRMASIRTLAMLKTFMDLSWLANKDYRIIKTQKDLLWVKEQMEMRDLLGIDTETTGLNICSLSRDNPLKDKCVGICISWERNQGVYLPLEHTQFDNLDKHEVFKQLGRLFETKTFVTHNGLFDGKVFYDEGIRLNIKHDTMLMAFNIDSRVSKGSKGLKHLTEKRYGYPVIEFSDIFVNTSDYSLFQYIEEDLVAAYACADADHTLMLFTDMLSELLPCQIRSYLHDVRAQNELIRSEYYGKGLDMDLIRTLDEVNTKDMEKLENVIFRYTGKLLNIKYGIKQDSVHVFELGSSDSLVKVLVNQLGYPVKKRNITGKVSIDKFVLKALGNEYDTKPDAVFEEIVPGDIISCIEDYHLDWVSKEDKILIPFSEGKDAIRYRKYKLTQLIQKWRKLEKLRSSFFSVLINNNFEGKYYSPLLMTRAETARIIDPMQTLVGHLKRLIVPLNPEKQYLIDFDFAQIEYRDMAGESHVKWLVDRLEEPEADFHREGGAPLIGKAPEDMTKEERGSIKAVNFAIPYGMGAKGVMEARYGIDMLPELREIRMQEIEVILARWNEQLYQIRDFLNLHRAKALQEIPQKDLPWSLKGQHVSRIFNALGRSRVFDVSNMSKEKSGSIRRQAGNFPIQSHARETFVLAFTQFCDRCKAEGLMDIKVPDPSTGSGYRFENKVDIMAYIHDECLISVDADVNPYFMYKIIYEECIIHLKGHPTYYCGINVITNWYEGHAVDKHEAPIRFVQEKIAGVTSDGKFCEPNVRCCDYVLEDITAYIHRRLRVELERLYDFSNEFVDFRVIIPKFKNYFLKPKLFDFVKPRRKPLKESVCEWDGLCAFLESFIYDTFGKTKFIYPDNRIAVMDDHGGLKTSGEITTVFSGGDWQISEDKVYSTNIEDLVDDIGYQFSHDWDDTVESNDFDTVSLLNY